MIQKREEKLNCFLGRQQHGVNTGTVTRRRHDPKCMFPD